MAMTRRTTAIIKSLCPYLLGALSISSNATCAFLSPTVIAPMSSQTNPCPGSDASISTTTAALAPSSMSGSGPSSSAASSSSLSSSSFDTITILGLGSLISERSSRTTFPELRNFRLGRVPNYRRVFGHPASVFFQRGIADLGTGEICSLCAEKDGTNGGKNEYGGSEGSEERGGPGFVCSVFEVPKSGMTEDPDGTGAFVPSLAYLEREEEFDIAVVPYEDLDEKFAARGDIDDQDAVAVGGQDRRNPSGRGRSKYGVLCVRSTDEAYIARWGEDRFERHYGRYGIDTIWGWSRDSGIRPCGPYLRHCILAAKSMGQTCFDSFLDETFLVDRTTTVREYLKKYPDVMERLPPPHLAERYGG